MARRKNVKRIDPRYFLHETVNRGTKGMREPGVGGHAPRVGTQVSQVPSPR